METEFCPPDISGVLIDNKTTVRTFRIVCNVPIYPKIVRKWFKGIVVLVLVKGGSVKILRLCQSLVYSKILNQKYS